MIDNLRVAAIQMISTMDVEANLKTAGELLDQAAAMVVKLAVLPENWPLMGSSERDKLACQEEYGDGPLQDFMAEKARTLGLWLLGGAIPLRSDKPDHVYNSSLLFNPDGICITRYDKIHLFDVNVGTDKSEIYRESDTIAPGREVTVAHTPFGNIGLSICYDLRFPELYRRMLSHNITIIAVPSAFTHTTGKQHWETLLRARAVENLCFVIAAGQGGKHNETRETWGHSMIIGPWGDILASMEKGSGVICADLDLRHLDILRKSFPALEHTTLIS